MAVGSREEAQSLIDADRFALERPIDELTIVQWDPLFGAFAGESSRAAVAASWPAMPFDVR